MIHPRVMRIQEAMVEVELARLRAAIEAYSASPDALDVLVQLNRLVGAWRRVSVAKDRIIYQPRLASPDEGAAAAARTCRDQLQATGQRVEDHAQRWSSSALIKSEFAMFRNHAAAMISTIEAHFECERSLLGGRDQRRAA